MERRSMPARSGSSSSETMRLEQCDLPVPAVLAEDGEGDGGVLAHVAEAQAALVHVEEDAAVLPVVPGRGRVRLAARADRRDDRRVGPSEERVDLGRDGHRRHALEPTY
jgi:hypothetical protein